MPGSGATKEPVQWEPCHGSCPKSVRDALASWIALHDSRFQNHGAKTRKPSPSCPLVDGNSHVLSQPRHLTGNLCGFESKEAAGVCEFRLQRAWQLLSTLGTSRTRTLCEQG